MKIEDRLELPLKLVIEKGIEWYDPDEIYLEAEVNGMWIRLQLDNCPEVGSLLKGSTYTKLVLQELKEREKAYSEGRD